MGASLQKCLFFPRPTERPALNGALAGVTIKWQDNISGETFALPRTNTRVVRHGEPGLFTVTAIPLGARRARLSGAGDGKRFGGGSAEVACSEVCVRAPETKPWLHTMRRAECMLTLMQSEGRRKTEHLWQLWEGVTYLTQGIMGTKWSNFSLRRRRTAMKWMFPLTQHRTMADISAWLDHVHVKASWSSWENVDKIQHASDTKKQHCCKSELYKSGSSYKT